MADTDPRLLLLVDHEPARARLIAGQVARDGWRVVAARDREAALATLGTRKETQVEAIIVEQWASSDATCALVGELRRLRPRLPILLLTAGGSPHLAIEAMRAGATDYLVKPVAGERLLQALRAATGSEPSRDELRPLTEKMPGAPSFATMIGAAPAFRAALAVAAKAARAHGPVLIEGESGTGKELLVRAMHAASPRARLALRFVNLAGFPPSQVESVLFGHERGAFAGAFDRQAGAFEHADGGTLVLDEIDRLPPHLHERLLEFLREGTVRPIGASHRLRLDVRLLVCSNAPLEALIAAGRFGAELRRELAGTYVVLPPLRERTDDIPPLARHFLARIGEQPGLRPLGITDGALALLAAYAWPGNVRQLQAVLFRAAVFCDAEALIATDFPDLSNLVGATLPSPTLVPEGGGVMLFGPGGNLRRLDEIEADVIRLAIGHYRGCMSEVARRLGIGRSTLYRKLSELGIDKAA